MGFITNDVQQKATMSYNGNSLTIEIKEESVELTSKKEVIDLAGSKLQNAGFSGELSVDELTIDGEKSLAFTQDFKDKLDSLQTPMQVKGSVATKEELPADAQIGDVWLVGAPDSEEFEEFVCIEIVEGVARYESLGMASTSVSYSPSVAAGTVLGVITIDGVAKTIYAPVINNGKLTVKMDGETRATFYANNTDDVVADLKSAYAINTVTDTIANLAKETMTVVTNSAVTKLVCQNSQTAQNRCHEYAFKIAEAPASISIEMSSGATISWVEGTDLANLETGATYVGSVFGDNNMGFFGVIRKFE